MLRISHVVLFYIKSINVWYIWYKFYVEKHNSDSDILLSSVIPKTVHRKLQWLILFALKGSVIYFVRKVSVIHVTKNQWLQFCICGIIRTGLPIIPKQNITAANFLYKIYQIIQINTRDIFINQQFNWWFAYRKISQHIFIFDTVLM